MLTEVAAVRQTNNRTILEIVLVTIFQLVLHGCHAKFCLRKHLSFLLKYKKNSLNIKTILVKKISLRLGNI